MPSSSSSSSLASYVTIRPNLVHLSLPPAPVSFSSFLGNSSKLAGLPRTWDGLELSSEADGDDGSRKKECGKERTGEREQREGKEHGKNYRWEEIQKKSEKCKKRDPRGSEEGTKRCTIETGVETVWQGKFSRVRTPRLMIYLYDDCVPHRFSRFCISIYREIVLFSFINHGIVKN